MMDWKLLFSPCFVLFPCNSSRIAQSVWETIAKLDMYWKREDSRQCRHTCREREREKIPIFLFLFRRIYTIKVVVDVFIHLEVKLELYTTTTIYRYSCICCRIWTYTGQLPNCNEEINWFARDFTSMTLETHFPLVGKKGIPIKQKQNKKGKDIGRQKNKTKQNRVSSTNQGGREVIREDILRSSIYIVWRQPDYGHHVRFIDRGFLILFRYIRITLYSFVSHYFLSAVGCNIKKPFLDILIIAHHTHTHTHT